MQFNTTDRPLKTTSTALQGTNSVKGSDDPLELKVKVTTYSKEDIEGFFPIKMKVYPRDIEEINRLATDPIMADAFKENIVSFSSVLTSSKSSVANYVNCVNFVSNRLLGMSHIAAWSKVFPERRKRLDDLGTHINSIGNHARVFSRSKLVTAITKQTLVPSYIYNASLFQQALNVTANIMLDEHVSPRDRVAAAKEVMVHTAIPDDLRQGGNELAIQGRSLVEKLADTLSKLATTQQTLVAEQSVSIKEVAGSRIYDNDTLPVGGTDE